MKSKRQEKILELIEKYNIETQEELIARLAECGIESKQTTVSRDIKELYLYKEPIGGGRGSRFEAGPKKQRNQSRTHNGADTGSRGNSDVDRKGEQRSDRNHQNTDVADRTGQVMH